MSSLPRNWTSTKLGKVAKEMFGGGTPSTKNPSFWQGNIPWLTSKSLGDAIYLTAGEKTISEEAVRKSATHIVPAGNLIFATRVGVGKVVVTKIDVAISQDGTGIIIDPTEVDPTFLAYQLRTESVQSFVAQNKRGATIQGITRTSLQQVDVIIPPFTEQRRIAYVLSTVQTAIEQQERLIKLTRELKSALMHKLFTEGLHGEKQKMTEVGPVPESWDVTELSDMIEDTEQVNMRTESERQIKYIDVSSISREHLLVEATAEYLLKDAPGRARKKVKAGDVIFATVRPTLLRVAHISEELNNQVCSTAFCVLRAKEDVSDKYIYYVVQREQFIKQLSAIESGANYPAVTDRQVKNQKIPKPKYDEQVKIAEILDACDIKVLQHAKKRKILEELFRTLLHQLMTGQTRVNDIDLPGFAEG